MFLVCGVGEEGGSPNAKQPWFPSIPTVALETKANTTVTPQPTAASSNKNPIKQIWESMWDLSCCLGEEVSHVVMFFVLKPKIKCDQNVYLPVSQFALAVLNRQWST